jgi:hypothetical protein
MRQLECGNARNQTLQSISPIAMAAWRNKHRCATQDSLQHFQKKLKNKHLNFNKAHIVQNTPHKSTEIK